MKSLALLLALLGRPLLAGPPRPLAVPSRPGTVWRYRATVEYQEGNEPAKTKTMSWKSTAMASRQSSAATAVLLRGFPSDLAWYTHETQPPLAIIAARPKGLYLDELDPETMDSKELTTFLTDGSQGEQMLGAHPKIGDCYAGDDDARPGMGRWCVEKQITWHGHHGWEVMYRTNPDHTIIDFVPGIGVTYYEYEHHGSIASVKATLISVTVPGRK